MDRKWTKEELIQLREKEGRCVACGGIMMPKKGKNGPFMSCVYYPECDHSREMTEKERFIFTDFS